MVSAMVKGEGKERAVVAVRGGRKEQMRLQQALGTLARDMALVTAKDRAPATAKERVVIVIVRGPREPIRTNPATATLCGYSFSRIVS
jgi:hypothetical protein